VNTGRSTQAGLCAHFVSFAVSAFDTSELGGVQAKTTGAEAYVVALMIHC